MKFLTSVMTEAQLFTDLSERRAKLRKLRSSLSCEIAEHGPDGKDTLDSAAACWRGGAAREDWCESCRQRQAAHEEFGNVSRARTAAMRRLFDRVRRSRFDTGIYGVAASIGK